MAMARALPDGPVPPETPNNDFDRQLSKCKDCIILDVCVLVIRCTFLAQNVVAPPMDRSGLK
eukprot:13086180-Heterocapsa_arctica.AAC.1